MHTKIKKPFGIMMIAALGLILSLASFMYLVFFKDVIYGVLEVSLRLQQTDTQSVQHIYMWGLYLIQFLCVPFLFVSSVGLLFFKRWAIRCWQIMGWVLFVGVALLSFCLIPEGETVVHKLLILLAALFYFVLYGGALFIFLNHKAVLTVMGQTPTLPLNENSSSVFLKSKKSLKGYLGDVFLLCSLLLVEDILYIVFEQNYSGDLESIGNTIRLVHGFIRFAIVFCSVLFLFGARKGLFTLSNWKPKGAQVHFIFFKAVPILLLAMLGIKCISNIFSVRFFSNLEFMIYVVAMAIAAELFFRHYLFNGFLRFMSVRKTVFYTSLCYAVFMLLSGTCSKVYYIMLAIKIDSASVPDSVVVEQSMTPFIANFSHLFSFELLSVVSYFLFGLVLAWAYARTRLIIVPILLHVMAFGVMYALTLLESTC